MTRGLRFDGVVGLACCAGWLVSLAACDHAVDQPAAPALTSHCAPGQVQAYDGRYWRCVDGGGQELASARLASSQAGLRVIMFDVGWGDAIAVLAPGGCAALIDTGSKDDSDELRQQLAALGVTRLDFVVLSHYHDDHLGGILKLEEGADALAIARAYDRGGSYGTGTYRSYAERYAGRRSAVEIGQVLELCGQVRFEVIGVNGNGGPVNNNENARSVVLRLRYGAFDMLLGGDLSGTAPDAEARILDALTEIEAYKVHHHGLQTSSSQALVDALQPVVALISTGHDAGVYGPAQPIVERLSAAGAAVWLTADQPSATRLGPIAMSTSDGSSFWVSQGSATNVFLSKGVDPGLPPAPPPPPPPPPAPAPLVLINEVLANEPGSDTAGEFVELVNAGDQAVDLSGWTLADAVCVRHRFAAGTALPAGTALVIYGRAEGIEFGVSALAASTGTLSLNNGGDTLTLADGLGAQHDQVGYGAELAGQDGVSFNRAPDGQPGAALVLHTALASALRSPGRRADGSAW